jgi:hypothetical protein
MLVEHGLHIGHTAQTGPITVKLVGYELNYILVSSNLSDIFEGVNFMNDNRYTLHSEGPQGTCNINSNVAMNGSFVSGNCAVEDSSGNYVNTAGCSINSADQKSLMNAFNQIGGGVQVMQWTNNNIKMWFFERGNIPGSLTNTATMPDVCEFGQPDAVFNGCDFPEYFAEHSIVFSNTFCGDYGMFLNFKQ